MPELNFEVDRAEAVPYAASPTLALKLRIASTPNQARIHTVLLRCQIQIEAARRRYGAEEQSKLFDLFGPPDEWGRTLGSLHWLQTQLSVPGFTGRTEVDLPVACTGDADVAVSKYFAALGGGEVPLCLLFSGTIFHATDSAPLQVEQLSWQKESKFRLPVSVWQDMMDHYYGGTRSLRIEQDLFDRLAAYKRHGALTTWDQVFAALLDGNLVQAAASDDR